MMQKSFKLPKLLNDTLSKEKMKKVAFNYEYISCETDSKIFLCYQIARFIEMCKLFLCTP